MILIFKDLLEKSKRDSCDRKNLFLISIFILIPIKIIATYLTSYLGNKSKFVCHIAVYPV